MSVIKSKVNTRDAEFVANAKAMRAAVNGLRLKVARAAMGGGEAARARHSARGRLLPRERIERLIDSGSSLPGIGQLAAGACTEAMLRERG